MGANGNTRLAKPSTDSRWSNIKFFRNICAWAAQINVLAFKPNKINLGVPFALMLCIFVRLGVIVPFDVQVPSVLTGIPSNWLFAPTLAKWWGFIARGQGFPVTSRTASFPVGMCFFLGS